MDPSLITADESNAAKGGSLMSPEFRRMVGLVWPHRRFIFLGFLASVVYGFLNSVSVMGVLPVLQLLLSNEGLHGWVDHSVAAERLHVKLGVEHDTVFVVESKAKDDAGLHARDTLVAYRLGDENAEPTPMEPASFFRSIADAREGAPLALTVQRTVGGEPATVTVEMAVRRCPWVWGVGRRTAEIIPREKQRRDRIVTLTWVLGAVVIVTVLSNVSRFVAEYYVAIGSLRGVMDLRRTLYRKILRLPMDFFARDVSDLVSRFVQDAQEIQRGLLALFGKTLREPIRAIFLFVWALWLDAQITLALVIAGPIAVFVFWAVGRRIRKANKKLLRTYGMMIGALTTTLQAIGVIKAYNAENAERTRLWRIDRKMFYQLLRLVKLEAILRPLLEVLAVIGIALVTLWLGSQVIEERIALPDFAQLILVLGMMVDPLRKLSDVYPRVMRSAAGSARIFAVADAPEETELREGAVELTPLTDRIEYRGVTFTYAGTDEPALRDVNLTIRRGETVAVVGANGSGKTTLTKLLNRFHEPQQGAILYDGIDVRSATLRSLRRQMSMVSQDPVVFAMTIAENIAYGIRRPKREDVIAAAQKAHAHGFIGEKPDGYDELVGERGSTLSGGQRQRVCIARAILREAPVLIFDEATSQIDSESEVQIQEAIRECAAGKTTILIAHRLSTIRFAQRVIVMDRGRIVDTGTHEELQGRCEVYAALCRTQLGH